MPNLIEAPVGEPLRIGQFLKVNKVDSQGRPILDSQGNPIQVGLAPPDDWPGKPKKRRPPPPMTAEEFDKFLVSLLGWGKSFTESVWSFFDVWASFTHGGKSIGHVKITKALEHVIEPDPDDPKGGPHVSAQLSQAVLTKCLTQKKKTEKPVYWDDLHEIEVLRKPGPDGKVPEVEDNDSPEEKKKKKILEDIVDRIDGQIFDIEYKITGKSSKGTIDGR